MNEDRKMTHFVVVSIHSSRFDCSGNDDDVSSGNSVRSHFSIFNVAYRIRYATASANSGEFIRIISSFFVLFDIQSHTKARCRRYCVVFASWRASVRAASIVDETSTSVRGVSALWFLCLKKTLLCSEQASLLHRAEHVVLWGTAVERVLLPASQQSRITALRALSVDRKPSSSSSSSIVCFVVFNER